MPDPQNGPSAAGAVNVLLVSAHDWFASALQAVLEPEGFVFARVRSARVALRDAAQIRPDMVIIDEGLPDLDAASLASALGSGPLPRSVPILVYSPNFWHESAQAAAMRAGAWDIIKEPVRSRLIVAKLRRLLEIKRLIELSEEGGIADVQTGLLNLAGLMRMMRLLGASAQRAGADLSYAVVGPTRPENGAAGERARRATAALCTTHVRESDACGWVDGSDVGIVAFGATAAGVTSLVRRLGRVAADDSATAALLPLSAGIVQLRAGGESGEGAEEGGRGGGPFSSQIASLSRFSAAQNALRQAREAGGGIRIAGTG